MHTILFATGIECSYPMVANHRRRDELADTRHYDLWRTDLNLCKQINAKVLRWGPPYYRTHKSPHAYDWEFCDTVLPVMRSLGIIPMIDMCHFGVPDWAGSFQNPDWPLLFADYAEAFARRYPWITYYTPVNEILVCATLSAKLGLWNEQLRSDEALVRSLLNQCRASLGAMERILRVQPEAVFFQSEACEITLERFPHTRPTVQLHNHLRFLPFDFMYGHPVDGDVLLFLLDNGMSLDTYHWLMEHGRHAAPHCVMGMDYYAHNEKIIDADGSIHGAGPILGWHTIAADYYLRYHKPMMLTETNSLGDSRHSPTDWLWNMWHNVQSLRSRGAPVIGYTWYSLQDQVDWDSVLTEFKGTVTPVGLFDLDRQPHPVALAFATLASTYSSLPLLEEFPVGSMQGPFDSITIPEKLRASE